jgi:hypothetical protein
LHGANYGDTLNNGHKEGARTVFRPKYYSWLSSNNRNRRRSASCGGAVFTHSRTLRFESLESRLALSVTAMLDAGTGDLVIEGSMLPDVVELQLNAGMQVEVLDGAIPVGAFDPNLITSQRIIVNLYDGSDTLTLPLINQLAKHFEISVDMGVESGDVIELLANVGPGGEALALELTSNSIHLGGAGSNLYMTNGLVFDGNVILDGSVTITTKGADFDAAGAGLSASNPATNLTIDTGGGEVRIGRMDGTDGSLVDDFTVESASQLLFLDVAGDVSVGTLQVDATSIAVRNNIDVTSGDAIFSSTGLITFGPELGPAITVDTHGHDLTFISGVTGADLFAIAAGTSFTSTGGTVTVRPQIDAIPIGLVSSLTVPDPGSLVVDSQVFDLFQGFDGFEVGGAQQSGTISVFDPLNVASNLHLHAGMGDIVIGAPITAEGDVKTTGDGGTTMIDANMAAASLTFNDAVRIDRNAVLTATVDSITFNGAVTSQANEANNLTIRSDGDVVFQSPVGDAIGGALGDVTIVTAGNVLINSTIEANSLVIVRPGDYNQNDVVDAADYVLWRKSVGTTGIPAYSAADGDGDTTIDPDDFGVWRAHFGQALSPPAAGTGGDSPAVAQPMLKISEPVAMAPAEAIAPRFVADSEAIREMSFTSAPRSITRRESDFRSAARNNTVQSARSEGDQLFVLLAIDRVVRVPQSDFSFANDDQFDFPPDQELDHLSLADEPMAEAIADWRW